MISHNHRQPNVQQSLAALDGEIRGRYADPLAPFYFRLDEDEVEPGRGTFAIVWSGDQAVGCGGIRRLDDETAELKRMYVVPEARRQGTARRLLRFLEREAHALGVLRLVLETVVNPPDAVALYRACGYVEIPRFGEYVDSAISYCMGRSLEALPATDTP